MAFITLGESKFSKFANGIALVGLIGYLLFKLLEPHAEVTLSSALKAHASAAYSEIEISSLPSENYTLEDIESLVSDFTSSQMIREIHENLSMSGQVPSFVVEIYHDQYMDGESNGWVVKFEVSTSEVSFERASTICNRLVDGFRIYIDENVEL